MLLLEMDRKILEGPCEKNIQKGMEKAVVLSARQHWLSLYHCVEVHR